MGIAVVNARYQWSWVAAALVAGLLLGGSASFFMGKKSVPSPPSEGGTFADATPEIMDLPMERAIDTLVDAGFRVMAVGHGRIKLHELGVRGHIVRVQGWHGTNLRYCTARLPDCASVPSR